MEFFTVATPIIKSIALALVTFIFGLLVIKYLTKFLENRIKKSEHLDKTLKSFIAPLTGTILKVLLVISVIKILGIDTSSFIAVIASAGVAVGLALQGALSNVAGGLLLLMLKPFKVGDYIEVSSFSGTVEAIQLLYTHIVTIDNKVIYIPNGNLTNTTIINYSVKETRRLDLSFTLSCENDSGHVTDILREAVEQHSLILKDPAPFVRMTERGENTAVYTLRVWTKAENFWPVRYDLLESINKKFEQENIKIPYSKMDVNIKNQGHPC